MPRKTEDEGNSYAQDIFHVERVESTHGGGENKAEFK